MTVKTHIIKPHNKFKIITNNEHLFYLETHLTPTYKIGLL